jgi:hypothetical protein
VVIPSAVIDRHNQPDRKLSGVPGKEFLRASAVASAFVAVRVVCDLATIAK